MRIESIPLNIGRRRQVLFDLKESVSLTPEEKEEIWPWITNWFTNEKPNSYAPRFNTQRTNYRCIFHSKEVREPTGQGIRARSVRQPLEVPCPFTMAVIAHYSDDAKTITHYTIDRSSINNPCPDHTHDLDRVDMVKRCDGLRAIAHHRMSLMAPDAKANVVFHGMKALPRFEEAGGKYFTNSEVYHAGREFRKPTGSSKNGSQGGNDVKNDDSPAPSRSSQKKRKRSSPESVDGSSQATDTDQSTTTRTQITERDLEKLSSRPLDEIKQRRDYLYESMPAIDLVSRVKEILSKSQAMTQGAGVTTEDPLFNRVTALQRRYVRPRESGLAHIWQPLSGEDEMRRPLSAEPDDRRPDWTISHDGQPSVQEGLDDQSRPSERRASVSVGELMWTGLSSNPHRHAPSRPREHHVSKAGASSADRSHFVRLVCNSDEDD